MKARTKLRAVSSKQRGVLLKDAEWRRKVFAIWGGCLLTGWTAEQCRERGTWLDAHHCYDKSIRPEWRHEPFNGIPLRRDCHGMADDYPEFHKALQVIADECRAAAEGRRPDVTRAEARSMIWRMAPKMRRHASPEE